MRRVSRKRIALLRIYTKKRAEFLEHRTVCEFPRGCTARATTIQHLRGRRGLRLLDEQWWAASCLEHNAFAEEHTGAALEMGWLIRVEAAS